MKAEEGGRVAALAGLLAVVAPVVLLAGRGGGGLVRRGEEGRGVQGEGGQGAVGGCRAESGLYSVIARGNGRGDLALRRRRGKDRREERQVHGASLL